MRTGIIQHHGVFHAVVFWGQEWKPDYLGSFRDREAAETIIVNRQTVIQNYRTYAEADATRVDSPEFLKWMPEYLDARWGRLRTDIPGEREFAGQMEATAFAIERLKDLWITHLRPTRDGFHVQWWCQ